MNILEHYLFRQRNENRTDKWVELSILKEYLNDEKEKLQKEIYHIDDLKLELHYKNILSSKIETRKKQINIFLENTLLLIKENE